MNPAPSESRPVAACTAEALAAAMNAAFEGYVVPVRVTAESFERRFRGEHLDPYASRLFYRDGRLLGLILVTRRGWTSRVGAMALLPEARGAGLGRLLLGQTVAEARARGDREMWLEVFTHNAPAVRLYEGLGFRPQRRLVGYRWDPPPALASDDRLAELDPLAFSRAVIRHGAPDLPWMLAAETFAAASAPARAWDLDGRAFALTTDPTGPMIALRGLVVAAGDRRQGWGRRLTAALAAAHPGRSWLVPEIVPEELGADFFASVGWRRSDLSQWDMRLDLGA